MRTKNVKLHCGTCDNRINLHGSDIVVIYNSTYCDYTYAFSHCNVRQVKALSPEDAVLLLRSKAKFMQTAAPRLSFRPTGEPINEIDLHDFRASLNIHDHLAAYA